MKPVYTLIDRRANKSQRNAWKVAFRAFEWIAKSITEEEKLNAIHKFTLKQYVWSLIEVKYWEPLKIKEQYKNLIDDLVKFVDNWQYLNKKERRWMISILMHLNKE
jgi:hypothetical protein